MMLLRSPWLPMPASSHTRAALQPLQRSATTRLFSMFYQTQHSPSRYASGSRPLRSILVTAAASGKRVTVAELKQRIQELERENTILRESLEAAGEACSLVSIPEFTESSTSLGAGGYSSDFEDGGAGAPYIPLDAETDTDEEPSLSSDDLLKERSVSSSNPQATPSKPARSSSSTRQQLEQLESGIAWPAAGESPPFWQRAARSTPLQLPLDASTAAPSQQHDPPPYLLKIAHITAEMAPVAKVGGLGDVVTGLAKACLARGADVAVILPYYECLPPDAVQDLALERTFDCPKGRTQDGNLQLGNLRTQAWTGTVEGVPVILLRPDWEGSGSGLFRGTRIYGGSYNEAEAYLYFCRASLEYLKCSGMRPDVIHAHEWQASAVPMLFWECFANDFPGTKPVLTIHNMDSSGECRQDEFAATGVSGELFATVDKALDERTIGHNPERLCLLKGGVVYASAITTVSPTYAAETLGGGAAGWLRSTLARPDVAAKYWGVLNGIDTDAWDPATDTELPACFSAQHPEGKALCKRYLQRGFGLEEDPSKPLVAVVTRLVPQKGIHLIEHAAVRSVEHLGAQFVLLGTGHADGGLRRMAGEQFKDNPNVHMEFTYSETLARMIYAAADIFLVPSMFEPCGLTQMIALRYGAVPVVRSTGGLADTVRDVDNDGYEEAPAGSPAPNGFVFAGVDAGSLESALDRAVSMFKERPEEWAALSAANMADGERWSWKQPAESYLQLYAGALAD